MLHMREQLIRAVLAHAHGEIEKHKANVNVYLEHPAGIGEHSDITEAIQEEVSLEDRIWAMKLIEVNKSAASIAKSIN